MDLFWEQRGEEALTPPPPVANAMLEHTHPHDPLILPSLPLLKAYHHRHLRNNICNSLSSRDLEALFRGSSSWDNSRSSLLLFIHCLNLGPATRCNRAATAAATATTALCCCVRYKRRPSAVSCSSSSSSYMLLYLSVVYYVVVLLCNTHARTHAYVCSRPTTCLQSDGNDYGYGDPMTCCCCCCFVQSVCCLWPLDLLLSSGELVECATAEMLFYCLHHPNPRGSFAWCCTSSHQEGGGFFEGKKPRGK